MTAQHPAAPETETDANGLTEAEREIIAPWFVGDLDTGWPGDDSGLIAAVERIVAERVRVVEGERDAVVEVGAYAQQKEATARAVNDAARMAQVAARRTRELAAMTARAESAEAAHEAEKAAHERLRAGVEALADEWAEDYPGPNAACNRTPDEWATDLRALLAGGGAR
ncbi:hypothetical protein [Nocardioides lacusdianchii]|uniref:hypothetical protein n=1 Tax=Nocardioides lacusdianchii TaxID=2783664 RepID=UPI001CCDADC7|nr:hypothetical protein [Nocardioides lacusdianchii]